MKCIIILFLSLTSLNKLCFSSVRSSFRMIDSISSKRLFSTMYQVHDHTIYDPLSTEEKSHMKRFSRFMKSGFAPNFEQKNVEEFNRRYNTRELVDKKGLESIKKIYFKKKFPEFLNCATDMFSESCPRFPESLELPVDRGLFMKKDSHPNLSKDQLIRCGHFLTDINNIYTYAYINNYNIIYSIEKSILLERFLLVFFTRFGFQFNFQLDQNINAELDELSRGIRGLVLPHFYTHPSDPYGFYVHQVAALIFIEMEKYRKDI